jgi:hypothetical protein
MRRLITGIVAMLVLAASSAGGAAPVSAAVSQSAQPVKGSTPQRLAAFNRLSAPQHSAALAMFRSRFKPTSPRGISMNTGVPGVAVARSAAANLGGSTGADLTSGAAPQLRRRINPNPDSDGDGIPDGTEAGIADQFVPLYHVSSGEGDVFATFQNNPTLTIAQLFGAVPPVSYYRVTPVGFVTAANGQQFAFAQIDYLTLWNADDGLQIGGTCGALTAGLGFSLDGLQGHTFDEEHSEVLVGAPVTTANLFPSNPASYFAYDFYRAAHEGTFFDHSEYLTPASPIAPNNHINYWLSLAKHSTYHYQPNGQPMFPDAVIASSYAEVQFLFDSGLISIDTYFALLYALDTVFFACVIEHFGENPANDAYPNTRINVGELSHPLNGSPWINDPLIQSKLTPLFWRVA